MLASGLHSFKSFRNADLSRCRPDDLAQTLTERFHNATSSPAYIYTRIINEFILHSPFTIHLIPLHFLVLYSSSHPLISFHPTADLAHCISILFVYPIPYKCFCYPSRLAQAPTFVLPPAPPVACLLQSVFRSSWRNLIHCSLFLLILCSDCDVNPLPMSRSSSLSSPFCS